MENKQTRKKSKTEFCSHNFCFSLLNYNNHFLGVFLTVKTKKNNDEIINTLQVAHRSWTIWSCRCRLMKHRLMNVTHLLEVVALLGIASLL